MGGSAMLAGGERDNSRRAGFAWDFADKPFGFALPTQAAEGSVRGVALVTNKTAPTASADGPKRSRSDGVTTSLSNGLSMRERSPTQRNDSGIQGRCRYGV
jgi:hypothetical protein